VGAAGALAGVVLQQLFTAASEGRRRRAEREDRRHEEQHEALVELIRAGRRVQRRLVDCYDHHSDDDVRQLAVEINAFAETRAAVRFMVRDEEVLRAAEGFERRVKALHQGRDWDSSKVQLQFMIDSAQNYEARRDRGLGSRTTRAPSPH